MVEGRLGHARPRVTGSSVRQPPLLSVIVPAHNAARTLRRALNSILIQNYSPIEVIVVDDASTDDTVAVAEEFAAGGVRVIGTGHCRGAAGARNFGIEQSRGEFIAFQDADDEWQPGKLDGQVDLLLRDPAMTFVSCGANLIAPDGRDLGSLYPGRPPATGSEAWRVLLAYNFVATPSVVARRGAFAAAGLFNTDLRVGEDQDMWIRLAMAGPIGYLDQSLVRVHDTPNSLSSKNFHDQLTYTLPMIRRHIGSRREVLSRTEIRQILGTRIGRIGRSALGQGRLGEGVPLVVKALAMGNSPVENISKLLRALLPLAPIKRLFLRPGR
ncbi:MAG: glycosyltransferase [Telmatospirillum sp.]|nr:glycosyltransferase [Telmatospirillum sp.]